MLRIISAYCPNPPTNGPLTVYAQQSLFLNSIEDPWCPGAAFLEDLCSDINQFLATGDQIVLLIDGNSDMKQSDLRDALENDSLREAILDWHGLLGPSTFCMNNSDQPIDGIWISPGLAPSTCGYFGYDKVFPNTDHRCLWVEFSFVQAFGHALPAVQCP